MDATEAKCGSLGGQEIAGAGVHDIAHAAVGEEFDERLARIDEDLEIVLFLRAGVRG